MTKIPETHITIPHSWNPSPWPPVGAHTARSREISVARVRIALEVLAVDEALDALLEVGRLARELELLEELGDEQRVREDLPRLHDPDDGGVDLVLPVLEDALGGLLVLLLSLAHLDRVDLDAEELLLEAGVEGEDVALLHLAPLGLLP